MQNSNRHQAIKMLTHKINGFEEIEIIPLGDWHIGSRECRIDVIKDLIKYILAAPNRFCTLDGDLEDNGVKSSVTSPYDAVMQPGEQIRYVSELLRPLAEANKILCIIEGNHEYRTRKDCDISPMSVIASKINCEHLYKQEMAFVKIDLGNRKHGDCISPKYCILVVHGSGGGALLGSGISRAESFAMAMGCDLLIMGHTHKPITAPSVRFVFDAGNSVMRKREFRILIGTGFMDYSGYPSRKMMRPVAIRPNKAILSSQYYDISVLS